MSITIEKMTEADVHAVAELEKASFSQPWTEEEFHKQLALDLARTYVAKNDGEVVGFINVWLVAGEINLNNIAVAESFQGRGIGRALITHMEQNNKGERCNLEVRVSNEKAIGLYKSLGFEQVGLRREFYQQPTEDAFLMTKRYGEENGI